MKAKNYFFAGLSGLVLFPTACSYFHSDTKAPLAQTVYSFKDFRPANMAISSKGRVFVTGHPIVDSALKVIEVFPDGKYKVYPNDKYANSKRNNQLLARP